MNAVTFHEFGTSAVLRYEDVPDPATRDGVLVRVAACAINHVDIDIRNGTSRIPIKFPHILGIELTGVVADAPSRGELQNGQRVSVLYQQTCRSCRQCLEGRQELCANTVMPGIQHAGGYADLIRVPEWTLIPLPDSLSFVEGACLQTTFGTAWHALIVRGMLRAGETVLISAAGSGVGSAAIDVAKWAGARVIATAGSDAKVQQALEQGASAAINYSREDILARVLDLTDGLGVDAALEHVGGEVFTKSLAAVKRGGRISVVGGHGGEVVPLDLVKLFRDEVAILGCVRGTETELRHVVELAGKGVFRPVIHAEYPLAAAAEAHRLVEERKHYGRVVLRPN